MGKWAKAWIGRAVIGRVGIVVAGTIKKDVEKYILSLFDEVIESKDAVYHMHIVKKRKHIYPLIFNVYGAPAMVDLMTLMHDGGCRTIVFIGSAYGFKSIDVGSIVVPDKCYHFDGIYHPVEPDRKSGVPDDVLKEKVRQIFGQNKISYLTGTNISVPAVSFQPPHANKDYQKLQPISLEMELAACFSRGKDIGIRTVGILVISDSRSANIGHEDNKERRNTSRKTVLKIIVDNLKKFNLPPLAQHKKFTIDKYLASVIEDPSDKRNVYRESK